MTVISLNGGDSGVSGIGEGRSGNSPASSSSSSLAAGVSAPKAAEGGLLRVDRIKALGRGRLREGDPCPLS